MKRVTLTIDEALLAKAVRLSGARTPSQAVALGLEALVRRTKAQGILALAGSGLWAGDLGTMRSDRSHSGGRMRRQYNFRGARRNPYGARLEGTVRRRARGR